MGSIAGKWRDLAVLCKVVHADGALGVLFEVRWIVLALDDSVKDVVALCLCAFLLTLVLLVGLEDAGATTNSDAAAESYNDGSPDCDENEEEPV